MDIKTSDPPAVIDLQLSVARLFEAFPQTIPYFLAHRMTCPGCSLAAFDTLADVVRNYGLQADIFLEELNKMRSPA